jgi:hypothetical protein
MQGREIIRKLGDKETSYLELQKAFVLNFRVKSRIDLFANLASVEIAINRWKIKHPLLRAQIAKGDQKGEFYFVLDSTHHLRDNVKFLKLDESSLPADFTKQKLSDAYTDLNNLLVQKDIYDSISSFDENGLLWRMTFLQVDTTETDSSDLEYEVLMLFHHVIADTISGYYTCLNLFHMIEIISENRHEDEEFFREMKVLPCLEDLYHKQIADYEPFDLPEVYRCSFIDTERAKLTSLNNNRFSNLFDLEKQFVIDAKTYGNLSSIGELLEESKLYGSRFRKIVLSRDQTSRLHELCRATGTKMSTFFHLLVTLALKTLCRNHGEKENNFILNISISLRQFEADLPDLTLKNDQLCYCVGALNILIDVADFDNLSDNEAFSSRFWEVCKLENDRFHNQIRNENQKFFRLCHELGENELNFHNIVTNVGRLKSSVNSDDTSSLRVTRNFTCDLLGSKIMKTFTDRLAVNLISCVEDQINWVVSFNSHFMEECLIDELVGYYFEILNKILL